MNIGFKYSVTLLSFLLTEADICKGWADPDRQPRVTFFFSPSSTADKVTPEIRDIRIIAHAFADGQGGEGDADN